MAVWLVLWALYLSVVNVGQTFYGFGWETLLLEAGFLAVFLGPAAQAPPTLVLWLYRWLLFRVEFGAGLIKLRGDRCWRDLTCLDYHHETQPLPGPLSWFFHHLPARLHRVEVLANHATQLVVPFGLFAPQPVAGAAALVIVVTQAWLLVSGNFSWLNLITIVLATSALALTATAWSPAVADSGASAAPVLDWSRVAAQSIGAVGRPPASTEVLMGIVHIAIADTVAGLGHGRPYVAAVRPDRHASAASAVATAAYRVLVQLVPAQQPTLDVQYSASLAAIPDGSMKTRGIAVGNAAAAAMIAARTDDGRFGSFRFLVGSGPGVWKPVLPAFVNDPNAWLKDVKPFLIRSPSQFRSDGPLPLSSHRYAREFEEVKSLGSATSTDRTADQTFAARYWAENPPATWSRIFRTLSAQQGLSLVDNARFFAMLYMTGADALISVWDDKAHWSFWRPITAIREADTDGNRKTDADPGWTPLVPNPPYPDHPSGFNCATAAFVHAGQDFFGKDKVAFTLRNRPRNEERSYERLSDALEDVVDARVWLGLHFRAADVQAAGIGKGVAHWLHKYYFRPVH